ncbi:MAG: hypothetical protein HN884_11405 [Rhodospirillaceae bacterium]|nr:hypothetical protein [Rhodospirillaceae bacterium]
MALTDDQRAKVALYIRMSLGAGLLGIGYGYFLQVMDRVEMTGWLHFEFAVRGIIIGAIFWALQIFVINGPKGERLKAMPYGPKVLIKTIGYLVVIEIGFLIGEIIFDLDDVLTYLSK